MNKQIDPQYYFPQYLGGLIQIGKWDIDVVCVFMFSIALGAKVGRFFALDFVALCTWLFVIVFPIAYSRTKKKNPNGHIKHLFYKLGFRTYPYYPDPFIKEFIN